MNIIKIAQISCGTEWSGIQNEVDRAATTAGADITIPETTTGEIKRAEELLGYVPASHALKVMLGQALSLVEKRPDSSGYWVDAAMILTCFRCGEGALVKHIIRKYLQSKLDIPVMVYSFTERTMKRNLLLRMEALANLVSQRKFLTKQKHTGVTIGVDSGSTMTKAVVMKEGQIVSMSWLPTIDILVTGRKAAKEALKQASLKMNQLDAIGVTGYGREILGEAFKAKVVLEEITVSAKGASYLAEKQQGDATIIDIGGTDSKAMSIHNGVPDCFTVGSICAGGSGRFLETAANRIGVNINDLGDLALKGDPKSVVMNAYCIVFGMQDIAGALASGISREDVAAAACQSVAEQFFEQQLQEIDLREPVIVTGGASLNKGLVAAFENVINSKVMVPPFSQYAGAVGAALLASGE